MDFSRITSTETIYHLNGAPMTIGTITELLRQITQNDGFPPEAEIEFSKKDGAVKVTRISTTP
jgi:hypothetical protein